jgi:DNA helicase-2/ATP-dependent DNA helicase PcrA
MTAHGSKGLEFDYVFIPYASEESWVGRARGASFVLPQKRQGDNDIRDVRRLFYVALTRAKKHAAILSAQSESDGKSMTPLRFIAELEPKSIATVSLPRVNAQLPISMPTSRSDLVRSTAMISLAQRVLTESGLSVTALNHFLECPSKFLYQSILKLPQAPSAAAEKGTAMHLAMANIWLAENRSAEHIKEIILESVTEYLKTSFLSSSEKESVKKDLFDDAPAVSLALQPHFIIEKNTAIFTERWSKTLFTGNFMGKGGDADGNKEIIIPLHGKLDAILDTGNELKIFDYKTREGMSENEIRGLTKNSDGGYFRQLVFYKMLLSDEPRWKGRRITPALVFISPDKKGRCPITSLPITDEDIASIKTNIQSLIDSVWSGDLVKKTCDDSQCEWCALAKIALA